MEAIEKNMTERLEIYKAGNIVPGLLVNMLG